MTPLLTENFSIMAVSVILMVSAICLGYKWCLKSFSAETCMTLFSHHYCDVIMGAMASKITSRKILYSTVHSGADQRKHQSSASLAILRWIHRWPVTSPHKWPVTRKMFPLMTSPWPLCFLIAWYCKIQGHMHYHYRDGQLWDPVIYVIDILGRYLTNQIRKSRGYVYRIW